MKIEARNVGNYETVWVCDYRRPDLNKKAIRSVKPTLCKVVPKEQVSKSIYYSEYALLEIGRNGPTKKVISIFDNTGFRTLSGTPLNIFDNEDECIAEWNRQVMTVINDWEKKLETAEQSIRNEIYELDKSLMGSLEL